VNNPYERKKPIIEKRSAADLKEEKKALETEIAKMKKKKEKNDESGRTTPFVKSMLG
jgi:hypothetical protein